MPDTSNPTPDFIVVFKQLKKILRPYAKKLVITCDTDIEFHLATSFIMKNSKPLFFGSVKINKRYVSYHLMPVYVFSELNNDMSAGLKKRMQGKSCFNFTTVDTCLFRELTELTKNGYSAYQKSGYV